MKQFIDKAQRLGQKAGELRQAVKSLPGQAAKIREAVTMTGGELHQLRADVESSIHALRADTEERLLATMREINDNALVFEEAGYELTGMDLDMALHHRLAVHLGRFETVSHSRLRALRDSQQSDAVRSILAGILKAEETAANVELTHLQFVGLVVHAGLAPTIRMEWRVLDAPEAPAATHAAAPSVYSTVPTPAPQISHFPPMASMFESRPLPLSAQSAHEKSAAAAADAPSAQPSPSGAARIRITPQAESAASAWSQSALDRFKKMPGGSKYG